jgi:hypothetical protein
LQELIKVTANNANDAISVSHFEDKLAKLMLLASKVTNSAVFKSIKLSSSTVNFLNNFGDFMLRTKLRIETLIYEIVIIK